MIIPTPPQNGGPNWDDMFHAWKVIFIVVCIALAIAIVVCYAN